MSERAAYIKRNFPRVFWACGSDWARGPNWYRFGVYWSRDFNANADEGERVYRRALALNWRWRSGFGLYLECR